MWEYIATQLDASFVAAISNENFVITSAFIALLLINRMQFVLIPRSLHKPVQCSIQQILDCDSHFCRSLNIPSVVNIPLHTLKY